MGERTVKETAQVLRELNEWVTGLYREVQYGHKERATIGWYAFVKHMEERLNAGQQTLFQGHVDTLVALIDQLPEDAPYKVPEWIRAIT